MSSVIGCSGARGLQPQVEPRRTLCNWCQLTYVREVNWAVLNEEVVIFLQERGLVVVRCGYVDSSVAD